MKMRPLGRQFNTLYSILILFFCHFNSKQENNGEQKDDHTTSKDILTSATWDSIFGTDGELMNTLFSGLVDEYSSLVIAGLDSITG
jgi:hypothetical protein